MRPFSKISMPRRKVASTRADIALVDPACAWTVRAKDSPSTQGYTPFEGLELSARVEETWLRGELIYEHARGVIGKPRGQYLHRPTA